MFEKSKSSDVLVCRGKVDLDVDRNGLLSSSKIDFLELLRPSIDLCLFSGPRYRILDRYGKGFYGSFILLERYISRFLFGVSGVFIEEFYWSRILRRYRSVVCIEPSSTMIKAAIKVGVALFEIQHGVITERYTYGYSVDKRMRRGYLVHSDSDRSALIDLGVLPKDVVVIGYYTHVREPFIRVARKFFVSKPVVLVSLQWGLDNENFYEELALDRVGLPADVLDKLSQISQHTYVIFKIHPVDIARGNEPRICKRLKEMGFEYICSTHNELRDLSLDEVLCMATLHVTLYSSVVKDAARLGVKSVVIDRNCTEAGGSRISFFRKEMQTGFAVRYAPALLDRILLEGRSQRDDKVMGVVFENRQVINKVEAVISGRI